MQRKCDNRAQIMVEFTFAMIVVVLLIYGTIKAFMWVGLDLAERRQAHDERLSSTGQSVSYQLDEDFYTSRGLDLIFNRM